MDNSLKNFIGLGLGAVCFLSTVFVSNPVYGLALVLLGAICIFGSEYFFEKTR